MSSAQDPSTITYVPAPSVGHEIGIMFGFIGLMIVCTSLILTKCIPLLYAHDFPGELVFHTWLKMQMAKEKRLEREKAEEYRARGLIPQDQKIDLGPD
jgi:hypothetical protein